MSSTPDPRFVALSLTRHLGGRTFRALLAAFNGDLDAILQAETGDLRRVPGIGEKIAQGIRRADAEAVARALEGWQAAGVCILTWDDARYPARLRVTEDAPPVLFALGDLRTLDRLDTPAPAAVIGTRRPSAGTPLIVERVSARLVAQGRVIVSGLAYGVDKLAHLSALALPEGRTVAVLGSGVLNLYPPEHAGLALAIQGRGLLLCEVAPDAPVGAPGLVARNRIITGLCSDVVVVETAEDGGAMHAARFARAQGRRVFAVDLPASGNRALLNDGALPLPPGGHLPE